MGRDNQTLLRKFHEAKWDEQIIYEMSVPGERGIIPPNADHNILSESDLKLENIPSSLRRKELPNLPEVGQMRVNRHYMRLSQETLGVDVAIDIGEGTCTMKYSPKVQERMMLNHKIADIHPLQDPSTLQGILKIYYETERYLKSISGMDVFSFQPGAGSHAVFTNASIVRKYFRAKEDYKRDTIVTTVFSHPSNAGGPATAGFKVVDLMYDDELGYPSLDAFKSALNERTAAIFLTNPEDTGIFNKNIKDYVDAAHAVGALAVYDQANVNGIMGITRAREVGFDLIHYNLHKTFSSPHGGMGPGCGALGARDYLKPFLPVPHVEYDGEKYYLDYDYPDSIGKVRSFYGNAPIVLRAYMWLRSLGPEGVREAAKCAVLNNQYMVNKVSDIRGVTIYFGKDRKRIEQCRYSWEQMYKETGLGTEDILKRMVDYGLPHYWMSHHPYYVPEPFTLEPTESFSKDDIDEFVAILEKMSDECYNNPEIVRSAPHNAPCHGVKNYYETEPTKVIFSWKQYLKDRKIE